MTTTNSYKDTKAVDYLEAIKRNQLESRNSKSSSSNFDMTYMLPIRSEIGVSTSFTNTEKTLADYQVTNNTAKLIAYFPMDLDVFDAMNSNDGTVIGTETYVTFSPEISSTRPLRKAFDFDGSTYITLANESNFDFNRTDTFSFSAWVKIPTISAGSSYSLLMETGDVLLTEDESLLTLEALSQHTIISKIASVSNAGYYMYITIDGIIHFVLQNSTSDKIEVETTTPLNVLYNNIVITYSGSGAASGVKIYINGTNDSLTTVTNTSTASALNNTSMILGSMGDTTYKITGQIDEVQIWNVELTSGNVTDLTAGKQLNKNTSVTKPAILGLSDVT
jgi:hypothetical protein